MPGLVPDDALGELVQPGDFLAVQGQPVVDDGEQLDGDGDSDDPLGEGPPLEGHGEGGSDDNPGEVLHRLADGPPEGLARSHFLTSLVRRLDSEEQIHEDDHARHYKEGEGEVERVLEEGHREGGRSSLDYDARCVGGCVCHGVS